MVDASNIVFVVTRRFRDTEDERTECYTFDTRFNPPPPPVEVEEEEEEEVEDAAAAEIIDDERSSSMAILLPNSMIPSNPLLVIVNGYYYKTTYAVSPNGVYLVGGVFLPLDKDIGSPSYPSFDDARTVTHWDTTRNDLSSKSFPDMPIDRYSPHAHFFNGKLYVTGGQLTQEDENIGLFHPVYYDLKRRDLFRKIDKQKILELRRQGYVVASYSTTIDMFDPVKREWFQKDIPFPLSDSKLVSALVDDDGEGRSYLLFGSYLHPNFVAFEPVGNDSSSEFGNWRRLDNLEFDKDILEYCLGTTGVVVSGHVLWIISDLNIETAIVALSLKDGRYTRLSLAGHQLLPAQPFNPYVGFPDKSRPRLLRLGKDDLAIVWRDSVIYSSGDQMYGNFHCTTFRIEFERFQNGQPHVIITGQNNCIGPDIYHDLHAAFVLESALPDLDNHTASKVVVPEIKSRYEPPTEGEITYFRRKDDFLRP